MAAPANNPNNVVAIGNFEKSIKIMTTTSDDIITQLDVFG